MICYNLWLDFLCIIYLSDLNNELPVLPDVVYIQNNSKSNSIWYENCQFNLKSKVSR